MRPSEYTKDNRRSYLLTGDDMEITLTHIFAGLALLAAYGKLLLMFAQHKRDIENSELRMEIRQNARQIENLIEENQALRERVRRCEEKWENDG